MCRKWLIGLAVLVLLSPCIACFALFVWPDVSIRLSQRAYPGVTQIGQGYQYYGADSGLRVQYYWTADDLGAVRNYYEQFTAPFVSDPRNEAGLMTAFHPYGSELVYYDFSGNSYPLNLSEQPYCHYRNSYECINVHLFPIPEGEPIELPVVIARPTWTLEDQNDPIQHGTIIVHSYYVADY